MRKKKKERSNWRCRREKEEAVGMPSMTGMRRERSAVTRKRHLSQCPHAAKERVQCACRLLPTDVLSCPQPG